MDSVVRNGSDAEEKMWVFERERRGKRRNERRKGSVQFSSVAESCLTLRPHASQHARPPCPSPTPGIH